MPLRRCTAAPTGRISTAATRSLEMAVDGFTPNSRISIGVISAPPPAPVRPTSRPTTALPRMMYGSTCTSYLPGHPVRRSTGHARLAAARQESHTIAAGFMGIRHCYHRETAAGALARALPAVGTL